MRRDQLTFPAFVARKEAEAQQATLAPFTTEIDAPEPGVLAIGNAWTRRLFDGPFYVSPPASKDARENLPSTSLVFVQSHDGNTGASDPSTLGGGAIDKHLIYEGLSGVAADAVLAGAETVRGGDMVVSVWHPELVALRASLGLPRHPMQIVATLRGLALEDELLYNVPELRVAILTVPDTLGIMKARLAARPWIVPIVMKDPADLVAAFRKLHEMGITQISCIGGRTIARALIDAGLIQDLYLTTSPRDGGEPGTPVYPTPLPTTTMVRKRGTGPDSGVLFEHFRLARFPEPHSR